MIAMSKFVRLENNVVVEMIDFDPTGKFHPDFVFIPAPDTVGERDVYDPAAKTFTPQPEPEPVVEGTIEAAVAGENLDNDPAEASPNATA